MRPAESKKRNDGAIFPWHRHRQHRANSCDVPVRRQSLGFHLHRALRVPQPGALPTSTFEEKWMLLVAVNRRSARHGITLVT